ncbi:MAG: response regulator [Thiobacillus sp.]|nr:response regulator [Thiobacillus sp.]
MKTVLVVDDDPIFRMVMKRHLREMGFAVVENDSGEGVVEQVAQFRPLACLIDIFMDKKEGLSTIRDIYRLADKPKVIAVSADPMYLDMSRDLGADASLRKPIPFDVLQSVLTQLEVRPG